MTRALRNYIKLMITEMMDNARVSNQLINPSKNSSKEDEDKDEEKEVDEVNVAANIAGFTAPLGYSGQDAEGPGSKGERKKRKTPGWT